MHKNKLSEKDYPVRGYFHLDYPVHISEVESYVQNPKKIANHSFFPLLAYEQKNDRYVYDEADYTHGRPYKENPRPIKYAGHLDGYIYRYYAGKLNDAYNQWCVTYGIDDHSIAYRINKKGKSNIEFAAEVISYIHKNENAFILVGDFKSYFDSLNHQLLKKKICQVLDTEYLPADWFNIFKSVTNYGYVEKEKIEEYFGDEQVLRHQGYRKFTVKKKFSNFRKKNLIQSNKYQNKGVPQGVPISAVMANLYAIDFDYKIKTIVEKYNGIYRRYSDDFIIVIPESGKGIKETKKKFDKIVNKLNNAVEKNKLELSGKKTKKYYKKKELVYSILEDKYEASSIDYLGFIYDGVRVSIRQRSIERFYGRMKNIVKMMKMKKKVINQKFIKPKMKKIPNRKLIYNLFTDKGFQTNNSSNFISYVKRSQKVFDDISPQTNNIMMEQIKNRKIKLERLLGYRIHIK